MKINTGLAAKAKTRSTATQCRNQRAGAIFFGNRAIANNNGAKKRDCGRMFSERPRKTADR